MEVGMIGIGRMGAGMSRRLLRGGHRVVAYDRDPHAPDVVVHDGGAAAASLAELVKELAPPRTVWLMVPAGDPTESTVRAVGELLQPGDVIVDGGNSNFHDARRRGQALEVKGVRFLDCGTSGGIWGVRDGFCLMIGGSDEAFAQVEPAFATLAPEGGYAHVGPVGAGHYVKMVHNGIEYALLQGYAEGFEIMHASDYDLDLYQISELWRHGSVVRSWLLDLAAAAYRRDPELSALTGWVEDSGEGRWTVQEALDKDVPAPVINLSLIMRLRSRQPDSYGAKVIAALRNEFGGHPIHPANTRTQK
ncbi:MAG TPA: decarboxylating 6-phosphogluconate dehydrogenase [Actinomycetes bacterium]